MCSIIYLFKINISLILATNLIGKTFVIEKLTKILLIQSVLFDEAIVKISYTLFGFPIKLVHFKNFSDYQQTCIARETVFLIV